MGTSSPAANISNFLELACDSEPVALCGSMTTDLPDFLELAMESECRGTPDSDFLELILDPELKALVSPSAIDSAVFPEFITDAGDFDECTDLALS